MTFRDKLKAGQFVVTSELGPPHGTNLEATLAEAREMAPYVDAMNVTDLQGAVLKLGSVAVAYHLIQASVVEPIAQMTCAHRNRLALQSDLLSAWSLGIRNVLVLGGDPPKVGDHADAKAVYDLDAVGLMRAAHSLNGGRDLAGKDLLGKPDLFIGGALTPAADDLDTEISKMKAKVDGGCRFFQTQAVFEAKTYEKFLAAAKPQGVFILLGIIVIKSRKMAEFMNEKIPGVRVPQPLIEEIDRAANKKEKAIEIAVRLVKELKPYVNGFHIMPIGWGDVVGPIVERSGLAAGRGYAHHR